MKKSTIVFVAMLLAVTAVSADDFYPPQWRGGPLSVEAEWDFDYTPANWYEILPDTFKTVQGYNNETLYPGKPIGFDTHAEVGYPTNWIWVQTIFGSGITPIDGSGGDNLTFAMQNWIDREEWKCVRIQLTGIWVEASTLEETLARITNSADVVGTTVSDWLITDSQLVDYDGSKFHAYIDLQIWPNPDWEKITAFIPEGLIVDQVYIDTISLPEPATIAMLCLGGLMIRRKKT